MGMKQWVQRCQPVQLYLVLGLTIIVFIVELVISHITHALTLLMDSYHMLCNILALAGCIITIKYGNQNEQPSEAVTSSEKEEELKSKIHEYAVSRRERSLKNTFGWARIDIIVMLICCVFLASLCFSLVVEALQTLVHINHQDEMHYPIPVMFVGATAVLLNGICYLLIGGYTFHQGSFLYVTASGDVVLNKVVTNNSLKQGERRLSRTQPVVVPQCQKQRQGFREMCRDTFGCFIVIITSIIVYVTDKEVAKYIDPCFSIVSATVLMYLSYPYMKESCLILLQTIPDTINIDHLRTQLLKAFPDIINVHDLHVWQLTAHKFISTAHIIFENPKEYAKITDEIKEFFLEQGITQVTIQPEFKPPDAATTKRTSVEGICLMKCLNEDCQRSLCCGENNAQSTELHCEHDHNKLQSISVESVKDETNDQKLNETVQENSIPQETAETIDVVIESNEKYTEVKVVEVNNDETVKEIESRKEEEKEEEERKNEPIMKEEIIDNENKCDDSNCKTELKENEDSTKNSTRM